MFKLANVCLGITVLILSPVAARAADDQSIGQIRIEIQAPPPVVRPAALPALYVSLAGLQAYDGYSTLRGVRNGATETNGLVGGMASNPTAFLALKVGSTGLSIFFAERLWRNHRRTQAIALMVVSNGLMATVAARNARVLASSSR